MFSLLQKWLDPNFKELKTKNINDALCDAHISFNIYILRLIVNQPVKNAYPLEEMMLQFISSGNISCYFGYKVRKFRNIHMNGFDFDLFYFCAGLFLER